MSLLSAEHNKKWSSIVYIVGIHYNKLFAVPLSLPIHRKINFNHLTRSAHPHLAESVSYLQPN